MTSLILDFYHTVWPKLISTVGDENFKRCHEKKYVPVRLKEKKYVPVCWFCTVTYSRYAFMLFSFSFFEGVIKINQRTSQQSITCCNKRIRNFTTRQMIPRRSILLNVFTGTYGNHPKLLHEVYPTFCTCNVDVTWVPR